MYLRHILFYNYLLHRFNISVPWVCMQYVSIKNMIYTNKPFLSLLVYASNILYTTGNKMIRQKFALYLFETNFADREWSAIKTCLILYHGKPLKACPNIWSIKSNIYNLSIENTNSYYFIIHRIVKWIKQLHLQIKPYIHKGILKRPECKFRN